MAKQEFEQYVDVRYNYKDGVHKIEAVTRNLECVELINTTDPFMLIDYLEYNQLSMFAITHDYFNGGKVYYCESEEGLCYYINNIIIDFINREMFRQHLTLYNLLDCMIYGRLVVMDAQGNVLVHGDTIQIKDVIAGTLARHITCMEATYKDDIVYVTAIIN